MLRMSRDLEKTLLKAVRAQNKLCFRQTLPGAARLPNEKWQGMPSLQYQAIWKPCTCV
jgi:hypothetical protein